VSASDIATSIGALVAGVSLVAGFVLYGLNQRDAMAEQFWQALGAAKPTSQQLRQMVSYELASDLANAAIYSRDLAIPFQDLYAFAKPPSGKGPDRAEISTYLDKFFPIITVPLATPLAHRFEDQVTALATGVAPHQETFPGAYRVANSMALLCAGILIKTKELVRDEVKWRDYLPDIVVDQRTSSLGHLKWQTGESLTDAGMERLLPSKERVELLVQMIDITFDAYFRMTAKELKRVSRAEQKELVRSISETETIGDDLREAAKCLHHVFGAKEMEKFRGLLAKYEVMPSEG
jgi:hypothetical protein